MIKKLLAVLSLALFISACSTVAKAPDNLSVKQNLIKKTPYIEYMEEKVPNVDIVDFREDSLTLWLWVDNHDEPGNCDYVVVLGKTGNIDSGTGFEEHRVIGVWSKENVANPCFYAHEQYEEYVQIKKDNGA